MAGTADHDKFHAAFRPQRAAQRGQLRAFERRVLLRRHIGERGFYFIEIHFLQPHRNIFLCQKLFHVADGVGAEMENARGEDGVGFAGEQHFGHVFQQIGRAHV